MPLPLDEVYRLIAVARGDIPAPPKQQKMAQAAYRELLDHWTREMQGTAPGDLSITHESVQDAVECAHRDYRQRQDRAATRRLLQDEE